jgi:hypothetical protein
MGFLMKYIGPLTITPVITLTGLSLFDIAADHACKFVNSKALPPHQIFFSNWFIPFVFFDSKTLGNRNFVSFKFQIFYSTFSPFGLYWIDFILFHKITSLHISMCASTRVACAHDFLTMAGSSNTYMLK